MRTVPPIAVTTVGSWPRSQALVRALGRRHRGALAEDEWRTLTDEAVRGAVDAQERAGVDLVTDGEQRRDSFTSFVGEKLDGVRSMTLAEMLDVVEDKASFRRILETLDVPAFSIRNATAVGRLRRRSPLALDDARFLRTCTDKPIKVPLPGPYILTRAMWVKELTRGVYATKEDLGQDVVRVLREELEALAAEGVDFVQFDEPVLTELVFTQGQTLTFMCAALAARKDPAEELELAVRLMNEVVEGFGDRMRLGIHVCRGNWSQDESTLLSGSYHPLVPILARMNVRQVVLEYATPRAGELVTVPGKELGLGVVNPRTAEVETVAEIEARIRAALRQVPPERLFVNPDCGFGTFATRPMATADVAEAKLTALVEAAQRARRQPT